MTKRLTTAPEPDAVVLPPERVKIGAASWDVRIVEFDEELDLYGRTKVQANEIQLSAAQSEQQLRLTTLHEVLHAVVSDVPTGWDHDEEERHVMAIAPWLLAVIRDNPELIKYLTAE